MIVLLSDFGESEYVGVMKGVILSLVPDAKIVDLTHSISAQSVREGAWVLLNNYSFFPKRTIFVAVVDPGVGSERDAVMVTTKNYAFIGPDNGLLFPAVEDDGVVSVSSINIEDSASQTFHGRDVFARMAGFLETKQASKILGGFKPKLSVKLYFHQDGREGEIVRIDRFGNIITNIPPSRKKEYLILTDDLRWKIEWYPHYSAGPESGIFLVTGSCGTLEISARNASAVDEMNFKIGDRIAIE